MACQSAEDQTECLEALLESFAQVIQEQRSDVSPHDLASLCIKSNAHARCLDFLLTLRSERQSQWAQVTLIMVARRIWVAGYPDRPDYQAFEDRMIEAGATGIETQLLAEEHLSRGHAQKAIELARRAVGLCEDSQAESVDASQYASLPFLTAKAMKVIREQTACVEQRKILAKALRVGNEDEEGALIEDSLAREGAG